MDFAPRIGSVCWETYGFLITLLRLGPIGEAETLWGGKQNNGQVHACCKKCDVCYRVKASEWRLSEISRVACETVRFVLIMLIKSHG